MVQLTVPSDYGGAAMAAVAVSRALLSARAPDDGVVVPVQLFTLEQIVELIDSRDIRINLDGGTAEQD